MQNLSSPCRDYGAGLGSIPFQFIPFRRCIDIQFMNGKKNAIYLQKGFFKAWIEFEFPSCIDRTELEWNWSQTLLCTVDKGSVFQGNSWLFCGRLYRAPSPPIGKATEDVCMPSSTSQHWEHVGNVELPFKQPNWNKLSYCNDSNQSNFWRSVLAVFRLAVFRLYSNYIFHQSRPL